MDLPKFPETQIRKHLSGQEETFHISLIGIYDNDLPQKSGWLFKKSTKLFKRWQRRYFVLKGRCLQYYTKKSSKQPRCSINFDQITVNVQIITQNDPRQFLIIPLGSQRVFRLRSQSQTDLVDWAVVLYKHITVSAGSRNNIATVSTKNTFWRYPRISNAQFKDRVSTGDILLFTSKSLIAKLQRGVTRSKFDHVGLLLKYASGKIGLFQATGQDGVAIVMWDDFMSHNWHLLYSKLVYRALNVERTPEMLDALQKFISSQKGKKYKISARKLIFKKQRKEREENSYFCSELVARVYQKVGLLDQNIAACSVWPGRFADEKTLQLVYGELEPMQLIDFEIQG